MAINEEQGLEIDKLKDEFSYREIAKKLGISKSYVAKYLSGKVKIIKEECPQDVHELSTDKNSDINNTRMELKEYIDNQLENYSVSITKDDLEDFKRDIMYQVRQELKQIYKDIEELKQARQ